MVHERKLCSNLRVSGSLLHGLQPLVNGGLLAGLRSDVSGGLKPFKGH